MTRPVTSLEGFIRKITMLFSLNQGTRLLFRGHSKKSYQLSPSVYRSRNLSESEHLLLRQLFSEHPHSFSDDITTFDRLVRAQHYGLPTRLLDVSRNPLVALYFASCSNQTENGRVIVVKPSIDDQIYYDSALASIVANISLLKHGEKDEIINHFINIGVSYATDAELKLMKADNKIVTRTLLDVFNRNKQSVINEFNTHPSIGKICSMVQKEIPGFSARINPSDLLKVFCVVPKKTHARIIAQDGSFLIAGFPQRVLDHALIDIQVEHIDIDQKSKKKIIAELRAINVSEESLFPEIEKAAKQIASRYS